MQIGIGVYLQQSVANSAFRPYKFSYQIILFEVL